MTRLPESKRPTLVVEYCLLFGTLNKKRDIADNAAVELEFQLAKPPESGGGAGKAGFSGQAEVVVNTLCTTYIQYPTSSR